MTPRLRADGLNLLWTLAFAAALVLAMGFSPWEPLTKLMADLSLWLESWDSR